MRLPPNVSASVTKALSPFPARGSLAEIEQTIEDYINRAKLAQHAHYDGVEIMGSEGYLINQFSQKNQLTHRRM